MTPSNADTALFTLFTQLLQVITSTVSTVVIVSKSAAEGVAALVIVSASSYVQAARTAVKTRTKNKADNNFFMVISSP
jgi:hypothetical protein